jgi:hypothetical protein
MTREKHAVAGGCFCKAGTTDEPGAWVPKVEVHCDDVLPWVPPLPNAQRIAKG